MAGKKKGLGKGLDALLGGINTQMNDAADSPISPTQSATGASTAQTPDDSQIAQQGALDSPMSLADANRVVQVPVEHCQRGKYQPRRDMHTEALEELAESIRNLKEAQVSCLYHSLNPKRLYHSLSATSRRRRFLALRPTPYALLPTPYTTLHPTPYPYNPKPYSPTP